MMLSTTQTIIKAYKFATKKLSHSEQNLVHSLYIGKDKIIYTDDTDFLKHFHFTSNLQYLNNVCEYINDEYCLDLDIDQTIVSLFGNNKFPIIVDFATKSFFFFDKKWQEQWNQHRVSMEEDLLYRFLKFDLKSIYAPMLLATNSAYIKPIALMIWNEYKDVEGVNYIIYNFYDWASIIIGLHSTEKKILTDTKGIMSNFLTNKSKTSLSLPFSSSFISLFYKIYSDKKLDSCLYEISQKDKKKISPSLQNLNYGLCYLQSSNILMRLIVN